MATLLPFAALRPQPPVAARIAAVPYDVVNVEEARGQAAGNPLSFLHVSRAEIDLPDGTDPYADAVYARAVEAFRSLRPSMIRGETPSLYVYRLRTGGHEQVGLAACYSLAEYDRDVIKKHERTRRDKEDDRTRHMIELRAQTGPVFLTYRAARAVDEIVARVIAAAPLYDFIAPDDVAHAVWRVPDADVGALVDAFARIPALYIADGHHRAASAARARDALAAVPEAASFLGVAFPDNQVRILPYNRLVADLAGRTPAQFLAEVSSRFPVQPGPPSPERRGDVSMYLAGGWHVVTLGTAVARGDASRALDVSLLEEEVLAPILRIGDVRTDKRIDFIGGARGAGELVRLVDSGRAAVAFSMFPVDVDDLMAIADAGGIMPPKSTWFEPKLRDGLLIHEI
jgi:uncharacterized protein (DUF1015 family)